MLCDCLLPADISRRMPDTSNALYTKQPRTSHASCQMHRSARKQAAPMHRSARKQLRVGGIKVAVAASCLAVVHSVATQGIRGATTFSLLWS